MRRFKTLALALVVLSSGAAYASSAGNDWAGGEPSTAARLGPSELKAAMGRLEFSEKAMEYVLARVDGFATGYVRGLRNNATILRDRSLEDVIEQKLVPALGHTFAEIKYIQETGKTEIHVAEVVWARMDSETQNLVRRTVITAVEELLNEGSAVGSPEGGR